MVPKYLQAAFSPELEQEISTSHHSPELNAFTFGQNPFENLSPKQKEEWMVNRGHILDNTLSQSSETTPTELSDNSHDRSTLNATQSCTKVLKHGFVKRPWTLEEDQKLAIFVKREGVGKWKQAATLIFGRTGKQCRERWLNNLNPDVRKGNWTPEEDQIITKLYEKYGSKWTQIAKHIPGRTENSIKNRFYCALRNPATVKRRNQIEAMGFERSKLETTNVQELKKHSDELEDCVVKHEPHVSYGSGFDSNFLHENAQMWAVKEEGEEEDNTLHVKEEPQTKFPINKRFNGSKETGDKMMNLPVQQSGKDKFNVKTETENVKSTLQKFLYPIDCPVYNNNFFTKSCDEMKFGANPLQRTLGCQDQEILDHRSAFKVMSANGATQIFRHEIGSSLHEQYKNQSSRSAEPQMQHHYPPQAHTLPVTLMQNEGLPMRQIQDLAMNQLQQQQQRPTSRLNAFQLQGAPLKALDFSTRTQTQENNNNNCLLMPLNKSDLYSHSFSGVSETNLQSLGLEQMMKFEALRRQEETHANRRVDETVVNMMRAISNKIEKVSLIYSHSMRQLQDARESYQRDEKQIYALIQQVTGLGKWLTQAKTELRRLEAISHTQKSGSFMNNEAPMSATTNKRSLIDYDLSGTGWDQIIKKRK